jgi:oligoendopeptidase F
MLEEYRREYADFNQQFMQEYYLFLSGQKAELELTRLYDRYSDLFTSDVILRLKQLLHESSPDFETPRASINRLLMFATDHYLENAAKQLTEEISRFESQSMIEWRGREITFQGALAAIKTEHDRSARQAIYQKRAALIEASNDLRVARISRLHDAAQALGYTNYTDLYETLRAKNYLQLTEEVQNFVDKTEAVYVKRLDDALRQTLKIKIEDAERVDALYFLNLSNYDQRFPASELLRVYKETMQGLGIKIERQKNILIDDVDRPRKNPRAFCAPVLVPQDIRLVIRPIGGQSDYQAMLHEGGHAQHYAWAATDLNPEFKYTGDYGLTETFAFLFDHLLLEGEWLAQRLDFRENRDYIQSSKLSRLLMIRRYAAKLIYEREFHSTGDVVKGPTIYAEQQTSSTKFKTSPVEFLTDMDDGFYSANYLRAWAFEVMLRDYLKSKFASNWWASQRAGNFLKDLWDTGDRYNADEIASQIGIGPICFDMLIDEFNRDFA